MVAEVRSALHTNACQAAAHDLLKQELLTTQTRHQQLADEFQQARTTWHHDQERAAQTHAELSAEYVRLTTQHQLTEARLAAVTADLSERSEALAAAMATTHQLTSEITTLKAERDAMIHQVEVANERNRCLLIKHRRQCADLEKDILQLRTSKAALEHALTPGVTDPSTVQTPLLPPTGSPNMIQALSVYVTSTSLLSELFTAPRTPRTLLIQATCVLRSLAATRRVFFDETTPPDRQTFIRVLPEDNHALALFMLYQEATEEPAPPAGDLFPQHLPILFLEGMAYLHTALTPDLDISDLIYFTYPSDVTMQVIEDQLAHLFATLVHLHHIADTLTRTLLENLLPQPATSSPNTSPFYSSKVWPTFTPPSPPT